MSTMRFEEALKIIESGQVFTMSYVQFDKRRKTGGKLRQIEAISTKSSQTESTLITEKTAGSQNHYKNFTRNFYQCIEGEPTASVKKVHCLLIVEVNGCKVML